MLYATRLNEGGKNMSLTNTERQAVFKAKMYAAGYKQKQVWVPREDTGPDGGETMDRNGFIRKLDELTAGWSGAKLSELYKELVLRAESKKGEAMEQ
jgi:hypothetical protein